MGNQASAAEEPAPDESAPAMLTPDEPAPAPLTPDEPTPAAAAATAVGLGRVNLSDSSDPLLSAAIAVGLGRVNLPDEPGSATLAELLKLLAQRHIDAEEPTPAAATADEPASAEPRERESSFSTSCH